MNQKQYKTEVSKVLYMMASVFRDEVSPTLIEAWTSIMQSEDVTIPELQTAAVEAMKSREYNKLPAPAVLLDIIRPRVDTKALAESQADLVLYAVRTTGPYKAPTFSDSITSWLMRDRWPWGTFASSLEADDTKWWRRRFVEAYQEAAASPEVKRLPGKSAKEALKQIAARSQSTPPAQGRDADPPPEGSPTSPDAPSGGDPTQVGDMLKRKERSNADEKNG